MSDASKKEPIIVSPIHIPLVSPSTSQKEVRDGEPHKTS